MIQILEKKRKHNDSTFLMQSVLEDSFASLPNQVLCSDACQFSICLSCVHNHGKCLIHLCSVGIGNSRKDVLLGNLGFLLYNLDKAKNFLLHLYHLSFLLFSGRLFFPHNLDTDVIFYPLFFTPLQLYNNKVSILFKSFMPNSDADARFFSNTKKTYFLSPFLKIEKQEVLSF